MTLVPDTMAARMARIEARLHTLETAPRATSTSIRDGALVILDAAGAEIARLGKQADGRTALTFFDAAGNETIRLGTLDDTDSGILIRTGDPDNPRTIMRTTQDGQEAPYATLRAVAELEFACQTNIPVYVDALRSDFYSGGPDVSYDFSLAPGVAGSEMDFRIQVAELDGGTMTTVFELNAVDAGIQVAGTFTIPAACLAPDTGTDPRGRGMSIRIQIALTAGRRPPWMTCWTRHRMMCCTARGLAKVSSGAGWQK